MTLNKRKKVVKYRGSKTHGGGAMKKRRGAGSRGGRGMAGTGKRGDAKKPSIWKDPHYLGSKGFHSHKKRETVLNIKDLEARQLLWLQQGVMKQEKDVFVIDLATLGITKLLSKGTPTKKYEVTVTAASASAQKKITEAGGKVHVAVVEKKVIPKENSADSAE